MGGPNEFKTFLAWKLITNFIIFIIHSPVLTFNQYTICIQHFSENRSSLGSSGMQPLFLTYFPFDFLTLLSISYHLSFYKTPYLPWCSARPCFEHCVWEPFSISPSSLWIKASQALSKALNFFRTTSVLDSSQLYIAWSLFVRTVGIFWVSSENKLLRWKPINIG